ncbi:hypothetical protein [Pseudomonas sp. NBRC 111119]|uniref:hypothetical protein n=1 Tax=Pseudomonas sp. NBRC 111119 TaxID=1661034 RepID=UPI0007617922|nr:hypothetical protein [Pseudomonas sp. NBRC 111119]
MPYAQPPRPQLVYLAFGPATYHQEACFSIVSALACLNAAAGECLDIQVYTDNLQPYSGLPITTHFIDDATRQAWNAPHGYHFRSKHVVLRQVLQQHPLAVLIDTDTFFRQSPMQLFNRVASGRLLCNAIGPRYGADRHSVLYRKLHATLAERGLADDSMPMVNSGVIGLARGDAGTLDHALALMDELHPVAPEAYALEEFCLAVAAYRRLAVHECTDVIHHYWSHKAQFRAKIQAWLRKHGHDLLSAAALADVAKVNDQLPRPPVLHRLGYKALTLTLPSRERQFARELLYGCYPYPNEFDRACAPAWWDKALENLTGRCGHVAPEHVRQCLRHPGLRLSLGERRKDVEAHLTRAR